MPCRRRIWRKILNESHIRWRVIIVSACYSGIFIPVLKNDSTLIMTAADARHSSFGCDDTRDLTYFGEALLQDALPHACSLNQAYADTARIIHRREADEGDIHSNPKLFVGPRDAGAAAAARCRSGPQLYRPAVATPGTTLRRNVANKKSARSRTEPEGRRSLWWSSSWLRAPASA